MDCFLGVNKITTLNSVNGKNAIYDGITRTAKLY